MLNHENVCCSNSRISSLEANFSLRRVSILLFLVTFLIYLNSISKAYHYDSISLAVWAEEGNFYVSGQQHHVLLTLINVIFYYVSSQIFHFKSALLPLSILGCFLGALGNTIFFNTLNILLRDKISAVLGTLCIAFSLNYWRYSVLVETHILPTFFLICVLYFLVSAGNSECRRNIIYAGIFTSLSLFSSGANIIFLPVFFVLIGFSSLPRPRENIYYVFVYLKTILLCWFFPFLLFGLIVLLFHLYVKHQITDKAHNIIGFYFWWLRGQLYNLEGFQAKHLLTISRNIIESIFYFRVSTATLVLLYCVIVLSVLRKIKEALSLRPDILFFSLAAVIIFLLTFLFYEPNNLQRYTPLLIFLWPAIFLLLRKRFVLALIALFLFVNNLSFVIWPEHKEENNICLQEALFLRESTGANDIIVTGERKGGWTKIQMRYIPYFAGRFCHTLTDKGLMDAIILALGKGYKVLMTEDALEPLEPIKKEVLDSIRRCYSIRQYAAKGKVRIYQITEEVINP